MYQSQKSELARYGNFYEVRVIPFLIQTLIDNIDEIQFSFGGFNFLFLILGHVSYQTEKKYLLIYIRSMMQSKAIIFLPPKRIL